MKILLLGPHRPELVEFLLSFGDDVITTEEPLSINSKYLEDSDMIISYGYRHIIKKEVLDKVKRMVINLHISLLPWNRGSDPNLWSFLEDTPKGVTIHCMDCGIDTGDILAQQEVHCQPDDTLRTSYNRLSDSIEALFRRVWPDIRSGKLKPVLQPPGGSYHRLRDRVAFEHLLENGWDTPVVNLIGKAKKHI